MATVKVTQQEAGALRRFRMSADGKQIQTVLLRALGLARDEYEDTPADEEKRIGVNTVKRVLDVLYKDDLERLDEQ